ncbi:MAG TPA: cytochrome c oxidase subunit II [Candidatus Dormibacteraeota bacterium]|nr:cytochrome c oxidase subunit II [Candidatus Dormibacteraeota bacterium]
MAILDGPFGADPRAAAVEGQARGVAEDRLKTRGAYRGGKVLAAASLGVLGAGLATGSSVLAANTNFLTPAGPPAGTIDMLFYVFLACSIVVLVGVGGAIIYACFRFRRRSDDEMPAQIHGNARLERAWVIGPAVLLFALFILNVVNVGYLRTGPSPASLAGRNPVNVHVTGQQFEWTFTYSNGKSSIRTMEIPVNTPIDLTTSSKDVIHGFWVPQLGAKIDALPGITNHAFIEASQRGTYEGQCYEFCGVGHGDMLITVKVVTMAQYQSYLSKLS